MQQETLTTFVLVDCDFSLVSLSRDTVDGGIIHLHLKPEFTRNSNKEQVQISLKQPASSIKPGDWVYFGKQPFAVTSRCDDDEYIHLQLGHNLTVNYRQDSTVGLWVN